MDNEKIKVDNVEIDIDNEKLKKSENGYEIALAYMVGGLSSRFGGKVKQFAKVGPNNETFIEYSINQALPAGFNKIIFIVSKYTEIQFKEKFGDSYKGVPVYYALQNYDKKIRSKPWGTADALCSAIDLIDSKCVVCNGDDLYGEKSFITLVNHLKTTDEDATITKKLIDFLPENGMVTRGIFTTKDDYLTSAKEVFSISKDNLSEKGLNVNSICNINLFGLQSGTIKEMNDKVKEFKEKFVNENEKECFIHVELANLIKENKIKIRNYESCEPFLGITNPEDKEFVRIELLRIDNS